MVRIYYKNLSGDCPEEQSLAIYGDLVPERKEKINQLKNETLKRKRILTGNFLQHVLSIETGASVRKIRFAYGQQGKPELDYEGMRAAGAVPKEGICFNMSHSGDYVVIAVSDSPVGIDIEHKTGNYSAVAKRCFCDEEYMSMIALPIEEQPRRFLELWTMKEAYIKRNGMGMKIPFHSFNVCRPDLGAKVVDTEGTGIVKGYVISVCSEKKEYQFNK